MLEVFIAVAEELNFRAAAERLNMTQPPLTRWIARLEEELGVKLFNRDTRKVELTPSGLTFLSNAREILAQIEKAKVAAKAAANLKRGALHIGLSNSAFYSGAVKALWKFKESNPQIEVEIHDGTPATQLSKLRKGEIDLAILEMPSADPAKFSILLLDQEPLGVLAPSQHRLGKRKHASVRDLDGETLIMHERKEREGFYDAVLSLFKKSGANVKVHVREKDQNCVQLVSMGHGLLLTTKRMSKFATPGTKFLSLEDDLAKMTIGAVWEKENDSASLKSFLNFLKNQEHIAAPKSACLMSLANW